MAPNANISVIHFILCCFTFPPLRNRAPLPTTRASEFVAGRVQFSASSGLVNLKNSPNTSVTDVMLNPAIWDLAFFLPEALFGQFLRPYFQLQFGCVLLPVEVSCFWLLPSANISQICSPPARLD